MDLKNGLKISLDISTMEKNATSLIIENTLINGVLSANSQMKKRLK